MSERFEPASLIVFAKQLFLKAGLDHEKADVIAQRLVDADLMGHSTHGLQLAPMYLKDAVEGRMTIEGQPTTLTDKSSVVVLDGHRLPGLWLTDCAVDKAIERARMFGVGTVTMRQCHHIGCLATYLPKATEAGCMIIIASSDPAVATVAPFGGKAPLFTPNPIAIGIPTNGDPVLIDISASITTNGMCARLDAAGKPLPGDWVLDAEGHASNDPGVVTADPPGTILPLGGIEYGHKGFGLALMIEAMTQGLSGFGRADRPEHWGASVFVQAYDIEAFGGRDAFTRQTSYLADACRANPPRPGVDHIRVPGDNAMRRKRTALSEGVELHAGILENLRPIAGELGVSLPKPQS